MGDVAIVSGPGDVTVDQFRRALAALRATKRVSELVFGPMRMAEIERELAEGDAHIERLRAEAATKRGRRAARRAMRRRRGGTRDRAGRPL